MRADLLRDLYVLMSIASSTSKRLALEYLDLHCVFDFLQEYCLSELLIKYYRNVPIYLTGLLYLL